jgi:transposase-like protein
MAHGKPRDLRKEQLWRRWIRLWQASGLNVRTFCDRHDLAPPSFYAWRRVLQQRDAVTPQFVPVRVLPDQEPTASLEVVLAGGHRLRVTPGFDPATLRQLLAVLEEAAPC